MKKIDRHIAPLAFVALLLMSLLAGCERKDLYLSQRGTLSIDVSVYDIQLDLMWGADWQLKWQYLWDESLYGAIGYTDPTGVRANVYTINQINERVKYTTRNLPKTGGKVSLTTNTTYDMVFYNNDTEYILFSTDESTYYYATTRGNTRTPVSRTSFEVYNQPDQLFGTYLHNLYVTDDPNAYEVVEDEDGNLVYIFDVDASLTPYTYIYLCQVMLLNNKDEMGLRINGAETMTVDGLSGGVDLFTRTTDSTNIVAITQDEIRPLQEDRDLILPDGTIAKGDIFAARLMTWGLPGVDPLERSRSRLPIDTKNTNCMTIGLKLRNGAVYSMVKDITDQLKQFPAGGVVTVVIDAAEIPDSIIGAKPKPGGGFDASVDGWQNEVEADVII